MLYLNMVIQSFHLLYLKLAQLPEKKKEENITNHTYATLPLGIEVSDIETGLCKGYVTASVAAKALGINRKLILNHLVSNTKKPVLGKYTFKYVGSENPGRTY
jgi:hypothetical protein